MTKTPLRKRPLNCEHAFQRIARACLRDIQQSYRSAGRSDPEGIHRMRIGLTRFAAARKFFSAMVADEEWPAVKSEIAWLDGILGEARDNDVALAYVDAIPGGPARGIDRQEIHRKVDSGHARVARALATKRYRALLTKVRTWIDHGPWTTAPDTANRKLREAPLERFASHRLKRWSHRLAGCSDRAIKHRRQHRVRIMAKRYRYMVEALSELGVNVPRRRRREAEAARRLQRALGDLRDLHRIRCRIDAPRKAPFRARADKLLRQTRMAFSRFS